MYEHLYVYVFVINGDLSQDDFSKEGLYLLKYPEILCKITQWLFQVTFYLNFYFPLKICGASNFQSDMKITKQIYLDINNLTHLSFMITYIEM